MTRSCKLFLGGLTKATTTELLYDTFAPYGQVVDAVVMERNGAPRGFGFVTFAEEKSAELVLANQVLVDGRAVDIKRAVPEEEMEHVPTKVFVGGLPQKVDRQILKQHFQRYGDVRDCVVMMDRSTGRSRGFGFVRFSAPEAVEAVLSAPQVLEGQVVDCKRAQPAEQLPPPKNPRSRQAETEQPDLTQWLQLLQQSSAFNHWPAFDWGYGAYDAGLAYDASAFDPTYFDPSLFDPSAFEQPEPELPLLPLPELKAESTPLGDVSNKYLGNSKGKREQPLGDLSNLLAAAGEKRGFSSALKAAMKEEASSVASLAFGH
jgi:RNA-binding protein Musashi